MQPHLALAGALPALAAMWYVDRLDAKRPEPRWSLRRVAIAGGVATLPCIAIELGLMYTLPFPVGWAGALFTAFVVAAAVEELAKVLCVRWFVWQRPEFDERLDGIVYATRAGLGFALVENIIYLLGTKTPAGFAAMFVVRAILAVPGHAVFAGMMGYFAARKRFDGTGPGLVGGYFLAVLLHGTYDAAIFAIPVAHAQGLRYLIAPLMAVPLVVVAGGIMVLRGMARRALADDNAAEAKAAAEARAAIAGSF